MIAPVMQTVHKKLSPAISPKVSPGPTTRRAIPTSKSWDSGGRRTIKGSKSWDQLESARHCDVFGGLQGAKTQLTEEGAPAQYGNSEVRGSREGASSATVGSS